MKTKNLRKLLREIFSYGKYTLLIGMAFLTIVSLFLWPAVVTACFAFLLGRQTCKAFKLFIFDFWFFLEDEEERQELERKAMKKILAELEDKSDQKRGIGQ